MNQLRIPYLSFNGGNPVIIPEINNDVIVFFFSVLQFLNVLHRSAACFGAVISSLK